MTGTFVLSLDTEIAWGTLGRDIDCARWSFDNYRPLIHRLVELLDDRDVPATWAFVGHLLLDRCDGHPGLPQPHYEWSPTPDSDRDPCTDLARDPWYYGRDVFELVTAARTPHEIGSHSFTHILPGDPAVSREMWRAQLTECAALHRSAGVPMESFVFPRNQVEHVDLLPEHGVRIYRGVERRGYATATGRTARVLHLLDRAVGWPPPTYDIAALRVEHGVVDLPSSQFLLAYNGVRAAVPTAARVAQARRGLDRSVRHGHAFHLWFHPFNLGLDRRGRMFGALERILDEVVARRDAGTLEVLTMGQVAQRRLAVAR